MSQSIRLRVQLCDNRSTESSFRKTQTSPPPRFIYVLESPNASKIAALTRSLEKYIRQRFSYKTIQLVQLTTDDGYLLLKDDWCSNVLRDNSGIICVDMEKFVKDSYSTLNLQDLWCEMTQHDASDNREKSIQVGQTNLGELFIRVYGASDHYGLYVFTPFELLDFQYRYGKDPLIVRLGDGKWFIEAKWEHDSTSKTTLFLVCSLKVASSDRIWSNKLSILLDESSMSIQKGQLTCLSGESVDDGSLTNEQRDRLKELALNIPLPKYIGPEIDLQKNIDKKITKHECDGQSSVRMANGTTNTVTTHQDSRTSEKGTLRQHFVITHVNFSKKSTEKKQGTSTDKPLSVTDVKVSYQTDDGSWHPCEDIAIAPIALRDEEPRWLADSIIMIEPDKLVSYVIRGFIFVKGEPGRDNAARRRVHRNLPQPLRLKIMITDNLNEQCSLIVEQLNKPLEIDTSEAFLNYNQSSINDLLAFVYADDCEQDERIFLAIYLNKEDQVVLKSGHTYSITLERRNLRTMEFNARKDNQTEVSFESIYQRNDAQERKAVALFDSETFMLYAIRLEISTRTSRAEETVLLPLERIQ